MALREIEVEGAGDVGRGGGSLKQASSVLENAGQRDKWSERVSVGDRVYWRALSVNLGAILQG